MGQLEMPEGGQIPPRSTTPERSDEPDGGRASLHGSLNRERTLAQIPPF